MRLPNKNITVLTVVLLVVLLCLPVYGPGYFSEFLSSIEANPAGFVCAHAGADSDHESEDNNQQIAHCHELDEPSLITSGLVIDYSPVISTLTSSYKGALLPGYGPPIDMPPKNRV